MSGVLRCTGGSEFDQRASPTEALRCLFEVAHAVQQGLCTGHGRSPKAPLPQGASPGMTAVEGRHIKTCQGLHHSAELIGGNGRDQQLEFMFKQHIGMDGHAVLDAAAFEDLQKKLAISRVSECQPARHGAVDHVVGLTSNDEAG